MPRDFRLRFERLGRVQGGLKTKRTNMKTKIPPTLVIFKMEPGYKTDAPVAFFPEEPFDSSPYKCTGYAHIGQHSSACTSYAANLKPATPEQYAPLLKELERIGYENLKPVRKFLRSHLETRKAKLTAARTASAMGFPEIREISY